MSVLDKLRLDGKVAVVTGAGRGLGRAMALALAAIAVYLASDADYLTGQVVWIEGGALSHV